jgi:hypothetical protein
MSWRRRLLVAGSAVVLTLVVVGGLTVRWVVFPTADPIGPTDVIVVLGPWQIPHQIDVAEKVQAANPDAPVLLSAGSGCPPEFRMLFAHLVCFRPRPDTTRGEARWASDYATAHHFRSMAVVVTRPQLSRARLRFSRCWAGQLSMIEDPTSWQSALAGVPYQSVAALKAETYERGC